MIPTPSTSHRTVAIAARRLVTTPPIRSLSHATMGFREIAEWKEHRRRASDPHHHPKTETIFDLKVYTPVNKSSTWNVSYRSEEIDAEARMVAQGQTPPPNPKRFRVHSRHYATVAAGHINIAHLAKPKANSPIRLPAQASTISSLATETDPLESTQDSVFCSERQATEITDVPGLDVLSKLRIEKLSHADLYQSESKAPGHSTNDDDVPVEQSSQLRVPNPEDEDDLSTARGAPVWYP